MPQSKFQKLMFALITVIITVPCFVFYCSSYESGGFNVDVIKQSWILAFKTINPKKIIQLLLKQQ